MADISKARLSRDAPAATRACTVWDPLVRIIHWGLAATILVNGALTNPEHGLHQTVGYIAFGLVVARLLWGLAGPVHARFSAFPPSPQKAKAHLREIVSDSAGLGATPGHSRVHLSHNPLGALMVYNLWLTVLAIVATGYMIATPPFSGHDWVKALHESLFSWLMISVALHLGGVLLETWRTRVPLVAAMITGIKRVPNDAELE